MESAAVNSIVFEVPLTPPSVNHYKKPVRYKTRDGMRQGFALTPEANAFHQAVGVFARGRTLVPATKAQQDKIRYTLWAKVFLGPGQRGDGDNFWKCLADGLVLAGVIHSDARVREWHLEVIDEERENPRTVICVEIWKRS